MYGEAVLTVGRPHIRALLSEMHDVVGNAMILTKSRSPSQASDSSSLIHAHLAAESKEGEESPFARLLPSIDDLSATLPALINYACVSGGAG